MSSNSQPSTTTNKANEGGGTKQIEIFKGRKYDPNIFVNLINTCPMFSYNFNPYDIMQKTDQ